MRASVVAGVSGERDGPVLAVAAAIAGGEGMVVAHVEERSALVDTNLATGAASGALAAASTELSDRCHLDSELALAGRSVEWRFEVRAGEPAAELIRVVQDSGASFLVVGCNRPRLGLRRRKGSTVLQLLARSPVPVIVVPLS